MKKNCHCGRNNRWNNLVFGARSCGCGNRPVQGVGDDSHGRVETIVSPTETVVNTRTNHRTIRKVHPTHIKNINRNITRVENYYPVTESVENQNYVQEYDCGNDLKNPCCKPIKKKCNR